MLHGNLHLKLINGIFGIDDLRIWLHIICRQINSRNIMQRYPASEGYLRKIPVTSTDKFLSPLWQLGKFASPLNRYFSLS
jgi:hypothetical protein